MYMNSWSAVRIGTSRWQRDHQSQCRPAHDAAQLRATLGLTDREAEVVALLVQGKSNSDIAGTMHLAEVTVKKHVTSVLRKAGVENRQQFMARMVP